jgi:hypothetical protein
MESGGQLATIGGVVNGGCVNGVQVEVGCTPVPALVEVTVKGVQAATKVVVVEAERVTVAAVGHYWKYS